ncbi:hypothetical protein AMTR_s00207p00029610 [Amborella trichopoda]|uniref:Uncharacterized protein n=1 Tax=Amborella trichopoda TaxID=13333 RepID=W1P5P5_AMBTC|nr:hypothetical protein AMTR_s00207p00029610 [Amborella trichopoda]
MYNESWLRSREFEFELELLRPFLPFEEAELEMLATSLVILTLSLFSNYAPLLRLSSILRRRSMLVPVSFLCFLAMLDDSPFSTVDFLNMGWAPRRPYDTHALLVFD